MVYIFFGENDFLIREEIERIKGGFKPPLSAADFISLNGQKLSLREFEGVINAIPFLSTHRLILVYFLLERFEGDGEEAEPWLKMIRGKPDSNILVLASGKLSKENTLLKGLSNFAKIREFAMLRGAQLERWLKQRIEKLGSRITPNALKLLIKMVGEDQSKLLGEAEKLSLYVRGKEIGEKDVKDLVSPSREISIFRLIDGWIEGRVGGDELYRLLYSGEKPSHIIALLTRQLGLIVRAKEMILRGVGKERVQKELGLSDFLFDKILKQSIKLTEGRLKEIFFLLLEADLAIKTGGFPEEIALDIFQAKLLPPPMR